MATPAVSLIIGAIAPRAVPIDGPSVDGPSVNDGAIAGHWVRHGLLPGFLVALSMLGNRLLRGEVERVELGRLDLQLLDLVLVVSDLLLNVLEVSLADSAQTFRTVHAR